MRPSDLLSTALLFAPACTAWPTWPASWRSPLMALKPDSIPIHRRDNPTTTFPVSWTGVEGNTATTVPSSSSASASATGTGTGTATSSGGSTITGTNTKGGSHTSGNSTSATTSQTFNPVDPAGGLSMITPAATATSYYKINNYVTFAWNYTSLQATPSAVDVLASCSLNQATYTIALNQSITGPTQAVTWDTANLPTGEAPLLTGEYTLIVYDAASSISATPQAGYLAPFSQFTFGMYLRQSYVPLSQWTCATCSGALTAAEAQTLWFLLGTAGITVMSFGWFTGVAGLW